MPGRLAAQKLPTSAQAGSFEKSQRLWTLWATLRLDSQYGRFAFLSIPSLPPHRQDARLARVGPIYGIERGRFTVSKSNGDRLSITQSGIEALGSWDPLPTGPALIDYWRARLGKAERLILEALAQSYLDPLTKEEVAAKAGYEANGGGFNNALGRLRTLELVQGRGKLKASDNLFDAAAKESVSPLRC
jgi:hypothetical protein